MTTKQPTGIRNIIIIGLAVLLCLVWMIAADRVNAAPIAVTVTGKTPCNNGVTERTVAGTMTTTCGAGWSVGDLASASQFPYSLLLDSFEYSDIPVNRPSNTPPTGDKWRNNQVDGNGDSRPNTLATTTDQALYGSRSININLTAPVGTPADNTFQMFLYNNVGGAAGNDWQYVRELFPDWQNNKINRLRAWVKVDPTMTPAVPAAAHNFHFATFLRNGATSRIENESNNAHYYHYYNLKHEGNGWHQIIVDMHPSHQRSASGGTEHGVKTEPFPSTDPGKNYFDVMTYFYFDYKIPTDSSPATFPKDYYFDGVELYEDPNNEDVDHIYALWGIYNTTTGEIVVGWKRDKTEPAKSFDVKYAASSFHANGGFLAHGTAAPNGTGLLPYDTVFTPNGYNGMEYREVIDVSGLDYIYIAIKHEDETTRFREIRIPITAAGYPNIGGSE